MACLLRPPFAGKRGAVGSTGRTLVILAALLASRSSPATGAQDAEHPYFPQEFLVAEGDGHARISVVRDSTAGAATVTYGTKPSDAKEGSDYLPVRGRLHFPAGDAGPKTFDVPIVDDGEPEEDEALLLILYDGAGRGIDFSELVIRSNETASDDDEDRPGSRSSAENGSSREQEATSSSREAAGQGSVSAQPGGAASGAPPAVPADALAPDEVPTIVLGAPEPTAEDVPAKKRTRQQRPLSVESPGSLRPIRALFGLSAAMLAAGTLAFIWLRSRGKGPPVP